MEKYYRKQYIKQNNIKEQCDLEFQIMEWYCQDENTDELEDEDTEFNDKYKMRCFGVTKEGLSICCEIDEFTPFYYIKVKNTFSKLELKAFITFIKESYQLSKCKINGEWVSMSNCLLENQCRLIEKKDLFGFKNNQKYRFIRLVFNNYTAMNKSKYIFKNPISINRATPIKYKLYESNFEPFMRFCHIQDVLMAGWIKLPKNKYKKIHNNIVSIVSINWKDIISLKEKKEIANFLQASWDIETYSYDGTFPDPNKKIQINGCNEYPNVIYQIATTFKYYNENNMLIKHLLTLKKCEKIDDPNIIVEECKNEKQLIKRWIDIIHNMDPDVMYTYNGDTFDCRYLFERSKIHKLDEYLKIQLSKIDSLKVNVKTETFSSSAYGDSDFVRFYIPGRLNYDLLIHYKRNAKYPSYKLDYVANEILKEGKNNVTVKDIFRSYEEGTPEQIKNIGMYCIVDTELLQKLVDKQLILITIIQLANVTYVPISYLTTRGQTIKVFSQLLRKARQLDYLVPQTNFNEDSYPLLLNVKDHNIQIEHIGLYIKIDCGRNKTSSGKLIQINGKISEIVDDNNFIVLSNIELEHTENFTSKFSFDKCFIRNKQINCLSACDDLTDDSFTGATVLTATPGFYNDNIAVLDFASLYPTIMISRNLCYSTFIRDSQFIPDNLPTENGIYNINNTMYERIKWDDTIEYTLKHTCCGIGKSGKGAGIICGKQAYFEVTKQQELDACKSEIQELNNQLNNNQIDIKKCLTKIKNKQKELNNIIIDNTSYYYCRVHDPLKTIRQPEEKYQKKDVNYNYVIVQPHTEIQPDGSKKLVNQGVLPALLDELYTERKKVKKEMGKAYESGNKLLGDILNSTQLAIKVSLNSCYGFLGRKQGNLILKELGSMVTAVGRKLIQESKDYAEGTFLNFIKNTITQEIKYNPSLLKSIDEDEKNIILTQFKIK